MTKSTAYLAAILLTLACSPASDPLGRENLLGTWRAVLESPGGELPFGLVITETDGELRAVAVNGAEEAPFSSVKIEDSRVRLAFDFYDSAITAELGGNGDQLGGSWQKVVPEGISTLGFFAERLPPVGAPVRFIPPGHLAEAGPGGSVAGSWAVEFTDEDGTEVARGEFTQKGAAVTGTFLTPTGDYRYLEGDLLDGFLRLSTFDGGHAFLFHATLSEGGALTGDFWSRDSYHATWTARPIPESDVVLPDAWSLVGLTNTRGRFEFAFPDLEGNTVTSQDPRFQGKVVLVNIFGSWCPNCNDEAPLLADWHRRFNRRGLEIIGLAYEFTGDAERDGLQVRRYAERHGIEFPILLAGVSDKQQAAATLSDLSAVIAYPTSVFLGRDGKVRRIHTGFTGPGTKEHYTALIAEFESILEELLAEPAPAAA